MYPPQPNTHTIILPTPSPPPAFQLPLTPSPSPANPTQLTKCGLGGERGDEVGGGALLFTYGGELDYLVATPLYYCACVNIS